MIKVTFYTCNDNYIAITSKGHANYDERGKDIKAKYKIDEDSGYLELRLPDNIDNNTMEKSQVLFKTAFLSINDLSKGFPSNIKVEVKEL